VTNRCLVNISGVSAALDKHIVIMDWQKQEWILDSAM
jgi:hypothetical protein